MENNSKQNAYYTVEATFVITISIWVIMALLYTGMYVHDRMVIEAVSYRYLSYWVHSDEDERYTESEFKDVLKEGLDSSVFMMPVYSVDVSDGLLSKSVTVRYGIDIAPRLLRKIWGGDAGVRGESVSVSDIAPAKLKWDSEVIPLNG